MASNRIKGINIKIGADTKGLDDALNEIGKKGKEAKSELSEINRSIKQTPESVELWRQKQKVLTEAIEESRKKVKFLEDAQEQLSEQVKNGDIGKDTYRAFMRELEKARGESEKLSEELGNTGREIDRLGHSADAAAKDVDELGDKTEDSGDKAKKSSDGFTVMKGVLADLAAEGIKKAVDGLKELSESAMEFEDSIAKVSTIADASVPIEELQDSIVKLSNQTGISSSEIAENVYNAISAGQKTGDAVNFVENATKLAKSGFAETANALDILSTIMNAYGMEASEVTRVSDVLIQTQNLGKTTVAELSSAMGKVIPTANAYGVELEQLAAGYAIMTANGVATAESTTYMNSMLNELGKSSTKVSGILKDKTGKSFKELSESGMSLSDVLSIINDAASDQNKQFSDMWSSAEAGKAGLILLGDSAETFNSTLAEMSSAAGATETAFGKLDTKSYELQATQNQLKNLGIEIGSEFLNAITPIAEKSLPKIKEGTEWFVDNLPKILKTGKDMLPVINGIGTAWAVWKVAPTAINGAKAVMEFAKAVKVGESAMKLLNLTMLENPAVALGTAIVALTAAIVVWKTTQEKELSIAEKVTEAHKKETEAIEKTGEKISELNRAFEDNAESIDYESQRIESLWKQLTDLADASGKVKEADKDRAQYILGELNDALGTEYTMTGNQIDNYRTMQTEIDKLIAKKKAQAYLDAYLANAPEMAKAKQESLEQYQSAYTNYQKAKVAEADAQAEFDRLTENAFLTPQEWIDLYKGSVEADAAENLLNAKAERGTAAAEMNVAKGNYRNASEYLDRLDDAMKADASGDSELAIKILNSKKDESKAALEDYKEVTDEFNEIYKESIDKDTAALKLALDQRSQDEIDAAMEAMGETVKIGKQKGKESTSLFTSEMKAGIKKMTDEGFDISSLTKWAWNSGVKVSEIFGGEYKRIVQKQLDAGYDITDLLKWGEQSGINIAEEYSREYCKNVQKRLDEGYDISDLVKWADKTGIDLADVFGEKYYDIVQNQLDAGYNITALLEWGARSGYDISVLFSDEFMKKFQSQIDLGPNTAGLLEWAERTGMTLGELLGKTASERLSEWTDYLYKTNNLIPKNTVNSPGDAGYEYDPVTKLYKKRYANGGNIPYGGKGIIAEVGPELVEVMNGGVRITPLTGNARNSAVETAGAGQGQKNFYNTYNIYATISGDTDIRRISQKLAAEQKRIENAKGI